MTADVIAGIRALAATEQWDEAAGIWLHVLRANEDDANAELADAIGTEDEWTYGRRAFEATCRRQDFYTEATEDPQAAVESLVAAWLAEGRGAA